MIALFEVLVFAFLLALGMVLTVEHRDGRVRSWRLFHFEGGLTGYWLREARAVRWLLRSRPDLLLLGAAFVVLVAIVALPLTATLLPQLGSS